MQRIKDHLRKVWKLYAVAVWMIGVTIFLYYLNGKILTIEQTSMKLSSDVDSVESILISTDGNVAEIRKQADAISAKVNNIHQRVMRRR